MSHNKNLEDILKDDKELAELFFLISKKDYTDKTKLLKDYSNKLLEKAVNHA